jgi:hypothetical protein
VLTGPRPVNVKNPRLKMTRILPFLLDFGRTSRILYGQVNFKFDLPAWPVGYDFLFLTKKISQFQFLEVEDILAESDTI